MAKESNPSANVPLTKQAAGAVTGAVAGSIIGGPASAIVGGLAGAVMGHRVEQGKPAVPTEAVAAAKSAAKQVSRVPVGKAVRSLTAKAGVLKKTTKKTTGKKTAAKKTTAGKTQRGNGRRRSHCQDRPRSPGPQRSRSADNQLLAGHFNPPHSGREVASCGERSAALGEEAARARTKARYHHGFSANSQSIDAAKELMEVLKSLTAIGVMRSQGMEPGK